MLRRAPLVAQCREYACNAGDVDLIPGWEDPLEEEMATHSSIPTWEIPWTEKPGKLQSMGSLKSWTPVSSEPTRDAEKHGCQGTPFIEGKARR